MADRPSNSILPRQAAEDLLERMILEKGDLHKLSTVEILQNAMNMIMKAERGLHLQQHSTDKGNGYFQRELGSPSGKLTVEVPRDRDGDFRPQVLPERYVRDLPERSDLLEALITAKYSPNDIKKVFHALGLHYNPEETERVKEMYLEQFDAWKSRQLPEDALAIFIDGYVAQAMHEGIVRKTVVFVVLGVGFDGRKDLWDLTIHTGSESKTFWLQVFNKLIERGLKRPLIVVSDNFPGLKEAIQALFECAFIQLCLVHLQRNIFRNMGRADAKVFLQELKRIKLDHTFDDALARFNAILDSYQNTYPTYVSSLRPDVENYLAFLRLPKDVQKHFYTTNAVESFNSILEAMRHELGGFFQSHNTLKVAFFVSYHSLRRKWTKGVPAIVSHLYELRQLFAKTYGRQPVT